MALSADTRRNYEFNIDPVMNDIPVYQAVTIYEGAAVGEVSGGGYCRGLVAADVFLGFARRKADNASGASGAINARVQQRGVVELTVTGVTGVTDLGTAVYASADGTFTLTASGSTAIGKIIRYISSTTVMVYFEAGQLQSM